MTNAELQVFVEWLFRQIHGEKWLEEVAKRAKPIPRESEPG
jgi:hypothetical protein